MSEPRIPPLPSDQWPESVTGTLEALQGPDGQVLNIFATFARHPRLFKRWLALGGQLLQGSELPARDRELLILRCGWNCRSDYEWGQHARIGASAGLSDEEIGERLNLSPRTVQTHRSNILRKLDLKGTPKLIAFAVENGFTQVQSVGTALPAASSRST